MYVELRITWVKDGGQDSLGMIGINYVAELRQLKARGLTKCSGKGLE